MLYDIVIVSRSSYKDRSLIMSEQEQVQKPQQEGKKRGIGNAGLITIGEALEVTAFAGGGQPVTPSDVAAIEAAEIRATGCKEAPLQGLSSTAQSAVELNEHTPNRNNKIMLADVLEDATLYMDADKTATQEDAEAVACAEARSHPDHTANLRGVGGVVATAATLNERSQ